MGESFCSIFCGISLLIDEMPSEEQVLKDDFCFSNRIRLQSEISGILTRERLSFSGDINTLKAVLLETPEQNRSFLVEEILRDALSAIENAKGKYNEICCENDKTKKAYINQFITLVDATVMQIVDIRKRMKISLSDVFVSELKKTSDGYYNLICGDDEKNMNADVEGTPKKEDEKPEEKTVYTPELLRLFHKRVKPKYIKGFRHGTGTEQGYGTGSKKRHPVPFSIGTINKKLRFVLCNITEQPF